MRFNVEFRWNNDEDCDIYVNNTFVLNINHGEHGWDGMLAVEAALRNAAVIVGGTVGITGESGI